jgi:hypothetical protein
LTIRDFDRRWRSGLACTGAGTGFEDFSTSGAARRFGTELVTEGPGDGVADFDFALDERTGGGTNHRTSLDQSPSVFLSTGLFAYVDVDRLVRLAARLAGGPAFGPA